MQVQFTAWQAAPHRQVACVDCHIGEGVRGFVYAKAAGTRQLWHVVTGAIPRPVPPGAEMPAGTQAQTCLGCHDPARIVGDRLRVIREYADDEPSTETKTVLQLHVGMLSASGRAIHWHANPSTRIEYIATDDGHQTIPYVRLTDARGTVKEFRADGVTDQVIRDGHRRTMDCIDCHNTVGHPIAATAELAVDRAIAAAQVSRQLPNVRRERSGSVKASYPSADGGHRGRSAGPAHALRGADRAPTSRRSSATVTACRASTAAACSRDEGDLGSYRTTAGT
jgi:hypothetical protein